LVYRGGDRIINEHGLFLLDSPHSPLVSKAAAKTLRQDMTEFFVAQNKYSALRARHKAEPTHAIPLCLGLGNDRAGS
jgi:hypothetical protein